MRDMHEVIKSHPISYRNVTCRTTLKASRKHAKSHTHARNPIAKEVELANSAGEVNAYELRG